MGWRVVSRLAVALVAGAACAWAATPATEVVNIRGKLQTVRLYGRRGAPPVVVSSGDGGWIHLGPDVAEFLAASGFFVVGFDVKAYLSGFTDAARALTEADVPRDFVVLADFAARGAAQKPILVGVSEGAGLSVLAATADAVKSRVSGVVALGRPPVNELGWRWRDSIIYLTKGVPNEPTFDTGTLNARVPPLPVAALHSTRDEFVPVAEIERIMGRAREPKRLWIIEAADHRFSGGTSDFHARLLEAVAWLREHAPR